MSVAKNIPILHATALATGLDRIDIHLAADHHVFHAREPGAVYKGAIRGIGITPGALGAAYFLPTTLVPLLFITRGLIFWLLLRSRQPTYP
jgi:hypothetical protein